MNRDTATACWYRRLDPACFTDQTSTLQYAYSGELAAPAFENRVGSWGSTSALATTWGDSAPIAEPTPHPLLAALAEGLAALSALWRRPLPSPHQPR